MPARIEVAGSHVLFRDHRRNDRPTNSKFWIVPSNSAFRLARVKLVDEVQRLGIRFECYEPMRKTFGHVHHFAVIGRKRIAEPFAECGRLRPQIENAIPKRPTNAANNFRFSMWRKLIM